MKNYFFNGRRMPNIFERAMMYNVQTNDILKKYKSLSDDEKKFITKHPVTSYQFYNNSKKQKVPQVNLKVSQIDTVMPTKQAQ